MAQKKIVKSIKGDEVDFDLMRVKAKIGSREKPDSVKMREQYIDIRRRRNPRRNVADLEREQAENVADARAKIQQSKENRIKAEEAAAQEGEAVAVEETPTVETVEETQAVVNASEVVESTPEPKAKAKKKIVKNNS